MPNLSKITLPSGSVYDIKDAYARQEIEDLKTSTTGGMHYAGITTTAISDGSTTSSLTIDSATVVFGSDNTGAVVIYGEQEFVWNGSKWQEFGSTGSLKALAFKDNASVSYTPAGSVSAPAFTGESMTSTGTFTPAGSVSAPAFTGESMTSTGTFTPEGSVTISTGSGTANYTPEGTVSTPVITVTPSTDSVNSITAVGTLPVLTCSVTNENLTISFDQGTLPTRGSSQTVVTGIASATSSTPAFTGTGVKLDATYTGTAGSVSVTGTTAGSVSAPTFSGTEGSVSVTGTTAGSVSAPTFSGTNATITVS